jgi:hypothetical protein
MPTLVREVMEWFLTKTTCARAEAATARPGLDEGQEVGVEVPEIGTTSTRATLGAIEVEEIVVAMRKSGPEKTITAEDRSDCQTPLRFPWECWAERWCSSYCALSTMTLIVNRCNMASWQLLLTRRLSESGS